MESWGDSTDAAPALLKYTSQNTGVLSASFQLPVRSNKSYNMQGYKNK